jgi:Cu-Zn family superoxide dismutase
MKRHTFASWTIAAASVAAILSFVGVGRSQQAAPPAAVTSAIAVISPTTGSDAKGWVKFTDVDGGVKVVADITGLSPGKHGFHIHEFGDISDAAKGMATGGHYGPQIPWQDLPGEDPHPAGTMHHAGEMGNLEADASGHAHLEVTLPGLTVMGAANPIVGRSIIVHAKPDVGDRIGQGVIGVANPAAK